jgi:citrate synthase
LVNGKLSILTLAKNDELKETMKNKEQGFVYNNSSSTALCLEVAADKNPFLTEKRYLAGYDIEVLTTKVSYIESLYLLFKQELPNPQQAALLNALFVALINAGPRDEAVRASMAAGVSKTRVEHLLPIGLSVLGGSNNGAQTVEKAYSFIEQQVNESQLDNNSLNIALLDNLVEKLIDKIPSANGRNQQLLTQNFPGFGQHYGDIDELTARLSHSIFEMMPNSIVFTWCRAFNQKLHKHKVGINPVGLAAAVFLELKLGARESTGLYQLLRAPGILAQGMEQSHKPITAIPMLKDEAYHFTPTVSDDE